MSAAAHLAGAIYLTCRIWANFKHWLTNRSLRSIARVTWASMLEITWGVVSSAGGRAFGPGHRRVLSAIGLLARCGRRTRPW